jgi:hypothetical protein
MAFCPAKNVRGCKKISRPVLNQSYSPMGKMKDISLGQKAISARPCINRRSKMYNFSLSNGFQVIAKEPHPKGIIFLLSLLGIGDRTAEPGAKSAGASFGML